MLGSFVIFRESRSVLLKKNNIFVIFQGMGGASGPPAPLWIRTCNDYVVSCRVCGKDYPKDTVIVHDFGKGVFVPSIAHFVMKLEAYLRMAKIPYEVSLSLNPYFAAKEEK